MDGNSQQDGCEKRSCKAFSKGLIVCAIYRERMKRGKPRRKKGEKRETGKSRLPQRKYIDKELMPIDDEKAVHGLHPPCHLPAFRQHAVVDSC